MANFNTARGWNPTSGWDTGNLPPGMGPSGPSGGILPQGHVLPGGYSGFPTSDFYGTYPLPPGLTASSTPYSIPGPPYSQGPVYAVPQNGFQHPVPYFANQGPRFLNPHPVVNAECPALNLQNSTGGMGCEPGYNYYFPAEHTKIHVIKSRDPPWRLAPGMSLNYTAYHVPCQTTLGELMKGFGASNSAAKKNRITEIVEGGNGRWYKGMTLSGEDKDDMKKDIKQLGWDSSRTGRPSEKPVVWLWVTKS